MSKELKVTDVNFKGLNKVLKVRKDIEVLTKGYAINRGKLESDKADIEKSLHVMEDKKIKTDAPEYIAEYNKLINVNKELSDLANKYHDNRQALNKDKQKALDSLLSDDIYTFGYLSTTNKIDNGCVVIGKKSYELPKNDAGKVISYEDYIKRALDLLGFQRMYVKNAGPFESFVKVMHSVKVSPKNAELLKGLNKYGYKELFIVACANYCINSGAYVWNKTETGIKPIETNK